MKILRCLLFLLCISATHVYFSPQDKIADKLITLIENEKESIDIAIYCFTHRGIAAALIAAKERGVKVEVVLDPYSLKAKTAVSNMEAAGIPLYIWDPKRSAPKKSAIMHDKFCIFGGKTVWTGSFNFTYKASASNAENVLVTDDTAVAANFKKQFQNLKTTDAYPCKDYLKKKTP